jgi:hypothetical protein
MDEITPPPFLTFFISLRIVFLGFKKNLED